MTTTSTSLIQMILNLLDHPGELAAFQQDPQSYLASCGAADATPADLHDALVLATDDHPGTSTSHPGTSTHHTPTTHHAATPAHHSTTTDHGATQHDAAVRYLSSFITNNYVDDRDTIVDNSVHQQVDTHGGDFDQDIDIHSTTASGDGAVAAGGSIDGSRVTTGSNDQVGTGNVRGDGNVVGDGNKAATGDHDTTSFGAGNASSTAVGHDLHLDDGAAFATGGSSTTDNSDNSLHNVDNTPTDASVHGSYNDQSDHHHSDSDNTSLDDSQHDVNNTSEHTHLENADNVAPDNSVHVDAHMPT